MDVNKIAKIAQVAIEIAKVGLPPLVGGYKALAALFGHKDLTKEEQDAIEVAVLADAQRRKAERELMAAPTTTGAQ